MFLNQLSRRGLLALSVVALALFVLSFGNTGAFSIRVPLSELSARSRVIAQGRVERIESAWTADGRIESTVYLRPAKIPRGALAEGALIPVKVRGGTVNGFGMRSSEEPSFSPGDEVYVFLDGPQDGAYRVVAGAQGKYDVVGNRAVNREVGLAIDLAALEAGVRANTWPTESALTSDDAVAAAVPESYVFNDAKWFGPDPMEEKYYINVNTGDANANGGPNAFINAIVAGGNSWNNAGAAFSFKYGGTTTVTPVKDKSDGVNSVVWENMGSSNTLAEATWWFNERDNVDQIVEVDIRFNDYYIWDATGAPASNEQDLQSVATHEMGHWLSLGHDTISSAVMYYSYQAGTLKRNLHSNDIAGIRAIYGTPSVPPTFTPTRTPTPTRTLTPTRTPTPRPTLRPDQIKGRAYLPMVLRR